MDLSQIAGFSPQQLGTIVVVLFTYAVISWLRGRTANETQVTAIQKLRTEMDGKLELSKLDLERGRQDRERLSLTIQDEQDKRNDATMNRFAAAIEAATAATGQIAKAADATNRILTSIFDKQSEASDTHKRNSVLIGNIERDNRSGMDALSVKLDVQSATLTAAGAESNRTLIAAINTNDAHTTRAIENALQVILTELSPGSKAATESLALLKELRLTLGENGRAHKIDEIAGRVETIQKMLDDVNTHIKKHDTGPLPPIVVDPLTITLIPPPKPTEHP